MYVHKSKKSVIGRCVSDGGHGNTRFEPDLNDAVGQAYGGVCCQTVYASTCRHPNGMEFDHAEWVVGQALC